MLRHQPASLRMCSDLSCESWAWPERGYFALALISLRAAAAGRLLEYVGPV